MTVIDRTMLLSRVGKHLVRVRDFLTFFGSSLEARPPTDLHAKWLQRRGFTQGCAFCSNDPHVISRMRHAQWRIQHCVYENIRFEVSRKPLEIDTWWAGGTMVVSEWAVFYVPPTQYRLYGRRFLQVKKPNQQYQSTEGRSTKEKENNENN